MSKLELYETGKGIQLNNKLFGSAQVIVNADGTKPRMLAQFDDTLNELTGKLILVHKWNESYPTHYTIGKTLRKDYANVLKLRKGVFSLKASLLEDYTFNIILSFIDSTTCQFETITFEGINYDAMTRTIKLPYPENDDYQVFLEESLTGMLNPAFEAVLTRCSKIGFVNKLYHGFTVNKYGFCYDTRNRNVIEVRR
jgi:hypothetical protein